MSGHITMKNVDASCAARNFLIGNPREEEDARDGRNVENELPESAQSNSFDDHLPGRSSGAKG